MKKSIVLFMTIALFLSPQLFSQEEKEEFKPSLKWSGFTHLWYGHVQSENQDEQYGFSIKYMRIKASGKIAPKVKYTVQFGFDKGSPSFVDVFMAYEPSDLLKVQIGQFPVPGAKSAVFGSSIWSSSKMMFNDRAPITQVWASNAGLKSYRSGGAMLYGGFMDNKLNYYAMLAMPKSGPDNYFNVNVKSPVYSKAENGLALYSRLEFKPMDKMEVGVNFSTGKGSSFDTTATKRSSYSAYLLTRQDKLFLMAEYIGGSIQKYEFDFQSSDSKYNGLLVEAAYKLGKIEPAVRFDMMAPVVNSGDSDGYSSYNNITIGANYYPYKNIVLMLNYVIRNEEPMNASYSEVANNLLYLQLRYKFASN